MTPPNKFKLAYFLLVIAFAFALLAALVSCDGCILGEASEACIMRSVHATETAGAKQFHIQLTEAAK